MMKKLIRISNYIAISILIMGIIHNIATFTPLIQDGLESLSKSNLHAMIYMSLMCGTSLILSGLLLIILLKKVEQYTFLNSTILLISYFVLLNGIAAVAYMLDNPFAWIILVLGLSMVGVSSRIKKMNIFVIDKTYN